MELYLIVLLVCLSFLAGFVDSIAGGGGLILVPSLLLAGLPPQMALGTNKFGSIFGTAIALYNFMRRDKVIWKIAGYGLAFSLFGSFLGTKAILLFDQKTAARIIIMMLPFTALITFMPRKQLRTSVTDFSKWDIYLFTPLICFAIGFYDGFFGPGSGSFWIFAFIIAGFDFVSAAASTRLVNFMSVIASTIVFLLAGKVNILYGLIMGISMMFGAYAGTKFALNRGLKVIKPMYLCVTITLISKQLYDIFWK